MSFRTCFITNCVRITRPVIGRCRLQICELSDNARAQRKIEEPVKFGKSNAATWRAEFTRQGVNEFDNSPWYQGIVVSLSIGFFLLYFCVFREENDIDEELGKTLYDRIEGLEELQLRKSLEYYLDNGLETSAIEERLYEIELEKQNRK